MSEDDNFLTRWSRRKAAAKAEPQPEPAREDTSEAKAAAEGEPQPVPGEPAEEVDLSALPPLDDITSATDITGFLKRGVPETLRKAALRKTWVSDPAIRDFIGLSENAWDFNDPAGIPGFGPLDMSTDQVRQMAAKLVGEVQEAAGKIESALDSAAPQQHVDEQAQSAEAETANLPTGYAATQQNQPVALQQEASADESRPARRGHGGALPH